MLIIAWVVYSFPIIRTVKVMHEWYLTPRGSMKVLSGNPFRLGTDFALCVVLGQLLPLTSIVLPLRIMCLTLFNRATQDLNAMHRIW